MNTVLLTILSLSLLGLVLALVLYFVAQKFKVQEDPRIDDVQAILPGANCGGCGYAGIAEYLGMQVAEKAPQVAVVRCNGSCDNRPRTTTYDGYRSCAVMASLFSGDTDCRWGCLGQGDCVQVCKFDAIKMNPASGLPEIDQDKCTACGACVRICPKSIVELRNKGVKNRRIYVACANKEKGGVARKACVAACIGCTKCQKICPFDAITITSNLAYIDANKCRLCRKCVAECPTHAILEVNFPERVPAKETAVTVEQ